MKKCCMLARLAALTFALTALACNADAPCDGDRCEKAAEPGFETDLGGDLPRVQAAPLHPRCLRLPSR
jgi:hypothetical protein